MCHKTGKAKWNDIQDDDIDIREITAATISEALAQVVSD